MEPKAYFDPPSEREWTIAEREEFFASQDAREDFPHFTVQDVLGMPLEVWKYRSCTAEFASVDDWATLYGIRSLEPSKGHATTLLIAAKNHYELQGFNSS